MDSPQSPSLNPTLPLFIMDVFRKNGSNNGTVLNAWADFEIYIITINNNISSLKRHVYDLSL